MKLIMPVHKHSTINTACTQDVQEKLDSNKDYEKVILQLTVGQPSAR